MKISEKISSADSNDIQELEAEKGLHSLRMAWGIHEGEPLFVTGVLRGKLRGGRLDGFALEELEHPQFGVGLVDQFQNGGRLASAAAAAEDALALLDQDLIFSGQWAVGELELTPAENRTSGQDPSWYRVKPGTLRLLSELPESWDVRAVGPVSAKKIAQRARLAIEAHLEADRLNHERNLAQLELENRDRRAELRAEFLEVEAETRERRAELQAGLERAQRQLEATLTQAQELENKSNAEYAKTEQRRRVIEREITLMENRYRQLSEMLLENGKRLVKLGLIDEDLLSSYLPEAAHQNITAEQDLSRALEGNFGRLAPLLQVKLARKGLLYSQAQMRDFLALLRTRDLVVLAGDSGSGKTSLIRAVAEAVGGRCAIIPVKPNWTGPEDLLGYFSPIERSYHATPFLLALQAAAREPGVPHFICLDEMNLARVEHYFADFLSLLEDRSKAPEISLYTAEEERNVIVEQAIFLELEAEARRRAGLGDEVEFDELLKDATANAELHRLGGFRESEGVLQHHSRLRRSLSAYMRSPTTLRFPENVWIFGAVNMDETTHHLSPKVLDRAHVLRFRNPMAIDWAAVEAEIAAVQEDPDQALGLRPDELGLRTEYPLFDRNDADIEFLARLANRCLDPLGIEFGFRAMRQAMGYLKEAEVAGIFRDAALDNVIKHKILPKIALDTNRPASDGRKRRDILTEFRNELDARLGDIELGIGEERSLSALDRLIRLADGNNGVANYWVR